VNGTTSARTVLLAYVAQLLGIEHPASTAAGLAAKTEGAR
jgi:hypothetical protein